MSTKVTLIVFAVVFTLGLFLIVILPFFLGAGPARRASSPPPPAPTPLGPAGQSLAPQPASEQGLFRSDDGGQTWQPASAVEGGAALPAVPINRLAADPADAATLFLATDGGGLFISRNRGETWHALRDEAGVLDALSNVLAVAPNPVLREEWYVAVFQKNRGRVLRTQDAGTTFREVYVTPLDRFGVFDASFDGARGAVMIATGQGGLLETANQGRTWRVIRWFADGLVRLLVNPTNPAIRFVATSRGNLFRTLNYGESWADVSAGYRSFSGATQNQRWFIDQAGTLYLGSSHGLLRSRDNGVSFSNPPLIIPPDALPIRAVAVDPRDSGHIVVSALNQIYASHDDGATWAILASPSAGRITHLLVDAERPETMYAVAQP